ncbi:PIR Superfamily Protein [Plasmodium ovale curtisi]|uniref:PIR Superfamily Protein n=1 Tax=Plasmodium ovale curtisi TaxID=864141 RepID=A0A1A8WM01_PLAOA|nr:PIR Superfamily Protein [Plasmodium ovale curtisi]
MSHAVPDIYAFFNDFKRYKSYDGHIETKFKSDEHKNIFVYFSPDVQISNTESANEICEKFICLYKLIISINKKTNLLDNNDLAYLNYWLNGKLRNTTFKHDIKVSDFYENMSVRETEFLSGIFDEKLYNIEEHDFQNMKLLDYLYVKHGEIYAKMIKIMKQEKLSCLEHFQNLMDKYKKGIMQCSTNNSNFCKALNDFKGVYERDFIHQYSVTEKCNDRELLKLPEYNDVSIENEPTVIGRVLGPSFGTLITMLVLYKFTPFEKWIRSKMRTNSEAHNNQYDEIDQSLLNTSDNKYVNSDYNEYNISYDSAANS